VLACSSTSFGKPLRFTVEGIMQQTAPSEKCTTT
jgi:hypothetical protein